MSATYVGTGLYRANEQSVLSEPRMHLRDNTKPGCILVHGHGANALQWQPWSGGAGLVTHRLTERGVVCLAIDAGGVSPWADDDEMAAMTAAYNYLMGTAKVKGTKVYVVGWSMGGLASLNWIKRNPTLVAASVIYSPATDITYFHTNNAGYASEIEADYGGAAAWQTNIVGHAPYDEPANYRGLPPIHIFHGDADTTVPLSQSQTFVSNVNDPRLTLTVVPGGTHTSLFGGVDPVVDVTQFLLTNPVT